jgi:hypothetical protein
MNWSDLKPARLAHHLLGGASFLLAPRRYLRSLDTDPPVEIAARIAALGIAFSALELLLFARSLDPTQVLFVGFLETAISLVTVPVLFLVIRSMGGASPWRVAAVYVLTMRFTFMVPAVILYAVFLLTEDYAFAALRGASVIAYIVLLFTVLPFAYFDRPKARLAALSIGLAAFSAYVWLLSIAFEHSSTDGSRMAELSLNYDPIGAELEALVPERLHKSLGLAEPPEFRGIVDLASTGRSDSTRTYVMYRADSRTVIAERWLRRREEFQRSRAAYDAQLRARLDSAKFRTTKRFLSAQVRRNSLMAEIASKLDSYAAAPRASLLVEFYDPYIKLQESQIEIYTSAITDRRVRNRLIEYWLLDPVGQK